MKGNGWLVFFMLIFAVVALAGAVVVGRINNPELSIFLGCVAIIFTVLSLALATNIGNNEVLPTMAVGNTGEVMAVYRAPDGIGGSATKIIEVMVNNKIARIYNTNLVDPKTSVSPGNIIARHKNGYVLHENA